MRNKDQEEFKKYQARLRVYVGREDSRKAENITDMAILEGVIKSLKEQVNSLELKYS